MSATGAIHSAILVGLAALLLVLSAAIVFLRRKRAAARPWRALSAVGQTIRRGVGKRPKLAAFCHAIVKRRWQLACLSLVAIAVTAWMLSRDTDPETEVAAVGVVAMDNPSTEAGAEGSFQVEIDPRHLARQDADTRRVQQGLALLAVIGLVAIIWATASRFATAR